jgi:hypothetical protein
VRAKGKIMKTQNHPPLIDGLTLVPCTLRSDGWLCIPHADNKCVTAALLQPFSIAAINYWLQAQPSSDIGVNVADAWQQINTLDLTDELVWLRKDNNIDGPRTAETDDYDRYEFWAPCESPSLSGPAAAQAEPVMLDAFKSNDVAEILMQAGWKAVSDAQWAGLLAALPALQAALTTPPSPPAAQAEPPHGWVLVPNEPATPRPDYDECARQADVATGLPSLYRNPWLNIFIREINRWCQHRTKADGDAKDVELTQAEQDVLAERQSQRAKWGDANDDEHYWEITEAAICYAQGFATLTRHTFEQRWPWEHSAFKPRGRRENIVRATAMLIAELDRIDRAAIASQKGGA